MSRAKDNWYVIVMTQVGPKFVTHVNWRDNIAEWNGEARPYRFDNKADAQEIARGLTSFNVSPAYAPVRGRKIYVGNRPGAVMTGYEYGLRNRPVGPGCQPMNGLRDFRDDDNGRYHDIAIYDRQLTAEEISEYELDYIGETE